MLLIGVPYDRVDPHHILPFIAIALFLMFLLTTWTTIISLSLPFRGDTEARMRSSTRRRRKMRRGRHVMSSQFRQQQHDDGSASVAIDI